MLSINKEVNCFVQLCRAEAAAPAEVVVFFFFLFTQPQATQRVQVQDVGFNLTTFSILIGRLASLEYNKYEYVKSSRMQMEIWPSRLKRLSAMGSAPYYYGSSPDIFGFFSRRWASSCSGGSLFYCSVSFHFFFFNFLAFLISGMRAGHWKFSFHDQELEFIKMQLGLIFKPKLDPLLEFLVIIYFLTSCVEVQRHLLWNFIKKFHGNIGQM